MERSRAHARAARGPRGSAPTCSPTRRRSRTSSPPAERRAEPPRGRGAPRPAPCRRASGTCGSPSASGRLRRLAWRRLLDVSDDELAAVLGWAQQAMRCLGRGGSAAPVAYRRPGRPCRRCATPIESRGPRRGEPDGVLVPALPAGLSQRGRLRESAQRRGRDLNPREACTPNGFRDRPVRPLRHPSERHSVAAWVARRLQ